MADRAKEQRLDEWGRALFETSRDALILADGEAAILEANEAAAALSGYPVEELKSLLLPDLLDPGDLRAFETLFQKILSGRPFASEAVIRTRDGGGREVEFSGARVLVGGEPHIHLRARDISESARTQELIRESEERYRNTLNWLADALHVVDKDLRIVLANRSLVQWCTELGAHGVGPGKLLREVFPFLSDGVFDEYRVVFKTGTPLVTQETNWVQNRAVATETRKIPVLKGGEVSQVITVIRDVSERKRAEEALERSEATLKSIFLAAPIAIGLVSNRIIGWTNEQMSAMTGYTRDELAGSDAAMLYPSREEYERVGESKYAQIRSHGKGTVRTRWKRKDGALIEVLLSSSAIDPSDPSAGFIFTASELGEVETPAESKASGIPS